MSAAFLFLLLFSFGISVFAQQKQGKLLCSNKTMNFNGNFSIPGGYYEMGQFCTYTLRNLAMDSFYLINLELYIFGNPINWRISSNYNETIMRDSQSESRIVVLPPPSISFTVDIPVNTVWGEPQIAKFEVTQQKGFAFRYQKSIDVSKEPFSISTQFLEVNMTYIFKSENKVSMFLMTQKGFYKYYYYITSMFLYHAVKKELIGTLYAVLNSEKVELDQPSLYISRNTKDANYMNDWAMLYVIDSAGKTTAQFTNYKASLMTLKYDSFLIGEDQPKHSPEDMGKPEPPPPTYILILDATKGPVAHTIFSPPPETTRRNRYRAIIASEMNFTSDAQELNVYGGFPIAELNPDYFLVKFPAADASTMLPQYFEGLARTFILEKGKATIVLDYNNDTQTDAAGAPFTHLNITAGWRGYITSFWNTPELAPGGGRTSVSLFTSGAYLNFTFDSDDKWGYHEDAFLVVTSFRGGVNTTIILDRLFSVAQSVLAVNPQITLVGLQGLQITTEIAKDSGSSKHVLLVLIFYFLYTLTLC